jgi:hypothetical protein
LVPEPGPGGRCSGQCSSVASEDVRLEELDEAFEERHDEPAEEDEDARALERDAGVAEEQVLPADDAQHEEDVAREHVAEEPQRERHGPRHEVREQLEEEDERHDRLGQARRDHVAEVAAEAHRADADDVVDDEHDEGQREREAEAAHRRVLDRRDDAEEVVRQDQHEHREEQRDEPQEVLAAEDVPAQAVADHPVDALGDELRLAGDQRHLARRHEEPDGQQDDGQDRHDHRPGERELAVAAPERLPERLDGVGGLEAGALTGGEQDAHEVSLLSVTGVVGRRRRASVVRTVSEPHHVESQGHAAEDADHHEDGLRAEPTIHQPAQAPVQERSADEVREDGPRLCFASGAG